MMFPYTIFTLQSSFKPLLLTGVGGGGGGIKSFTIEVTVNNKEENP